MIVIQAFIGILVLTIGLIPFISSKQKGIVTLMGTILISAISSVPAIYALSGNSTELLFQGTLVTGAIPVRIDSLSGWFILTINFTYITSMVYGIGYMKVYASQTSNLSMHWIAYLISHSALIAVCSLQNSIAFLFAWEFMALSTFTLVIFEHQKQQIIKAGINYIIQAHVSILFLTLGFIWVYYKTHSFDFMAIGLFSTNQVMLGSLILFMVFFVGFAIKAGFVPFHTWLPHAHPAAPSHVSAAMSGVIIKIGIYGILRMVLLIHTNYTLIGYFILVISVITGIYGVILAIIQHNLKKLLAYHSIENIGIIGIGIGMGCIGLGSDNQILALLGFGGALLHTLNHSLFKSLLFFGAGNIYQSTHTMNLEQLGGIGKRMPRTALLFLIASLAICGLPPFNGFVSEFIIYSGLFNGMHGIPLTGLFFMIFSVFGLALIGGLAILCFTKAFGSIFLGHPRRRLKEVPLESGLIKIAPMMVVALFMLVIGLFPSFFVKVLSLPTHLLSGSIIANSNQIANFELQTIPRIGMASLMFLVIFAVLYFVRKQRTSTLPQASCQTWGCGYVGSTGKMQYTASSFVRFFRKLAEPILSIRTFKQEINHVFPERAGYETHPKDKAEEWFVYYPIRQFKHFLNWFSFLQSGNPQRYVLYEVIFILLIIGIPLVYNFLVSLFQFLYTI